MKHVIVVTQGARNDWANALVQDLEALGFQAEAVSQKSLFETAIAVPGYVIVGKRGDGFDPESVKRLFTMSLVVALCGSEREAAEECGADFALVGFSPGYRAKSISQLWLLFDQARRIP